MSDIIKNAFENIDPYNVKFVEKNTDIVEEIYAIMEKEGIKSQKELARLLDKKESELSKLLSGLHNMTLRSITNLEVALGTDIIFTHSKAKEKFNTVTYFVCEKQPIRNNEYKRSDMTASISMEIPTEFQIREAS